MSEKDARLAYELARGQGRCSDNYWYLTKKLLRQNGLEVTVKNAQFIAELRKVIPRSSIGALGVLQCYQKADELLSKATEPLKGSDVLDILRQYDVAPHQSTVSRWFQQLGGYRKNRLYKPQDLKNVLTSAFIYKAQNSIKLPKAI